MAVSRNERDGAVSTDDGEPRAQGQPGTSGRVDAARRLPLDSEQAAGPVEVAPRVWWVGAVLGDDPFQCYSYLIEAGRSSVLVDPGSSLTIDQTLAKVAEVVPLDHIKTLLLHHSDPDCADSLHRLGAVLDRPDVEVLTEWRSELLLRYQAPRFPIRSIEDLGWRLALDDGRAVEFALTPYLHFPGAFVSYETSTRSLFTGDLFGGFNRAGHLFATGSDDLDDLRSFHEHYMPSREILTAGLATIRSRFPDLSIVLPQHGYVIEGSLVEEAMNLLFDLECGVMLMSRSDAHLARLIDAASSVRRIREHVARAVDVDELLTTVEIELMRVVGPVSVSMGGDAQPARSDTTWVIPVAPDGVRASEGGTNLVVEVDDPSGVPDEVAAMLRMLVPQVQVTLERLVAARRDDEEREAWRHSALHDALTGLPNRRHLESMAPMSGTTAVFMIDVDHFKSVNDRFGHDAGDAVLVGVAGAIAGAVRECDLVARVGGEEFLVVAPVGEAATGGDAGAGSPLAAAAALGERIRAAVAATDLSAVVADRHVTVSVGATLTENGADRCEPEVGMTEAVRRADAALYRAKESGRDCVVVDPGTEHG